MHVLWYTLWGLSALANSDVTVNYVKVVFLCLHSSLAQYPAQVTVQQAFVIATVLRPFQKRFWRHFQWKLSHEKWLSSIHNDCFERLCKKVQLDIYMPKYGPKSVYSPGFVPIHLNEMVAFPGKWGSMLVAQCPLHRGHSASSLDPARAQTRDSGLLPLHLTDKKSISTVASSLYSLPFCWMPRIAAVTPLKGEKDQSRGLQTGASPLARHWTELAVLWPRVSAGTRHIPVTLTSSCADKT